MSEAEYDVAAVGNAIVDVLCHASDDLIGELGLQRDVMQLVDEAESDRIYGGMPPSQEVSGGSAANTLVTLAALGGRALFVGKVRDDQMGEVFTHDLRAAGVGFDTAPATEGPSTARCLVLVTPDASRTMSTYLGAAAGVSRVDVEGAGIDRAAITYLEGYLWDDGNAKEAMRAAIDVAKRAGRKVAMTMSDPFCVDRHRDDFRRLLDDDIDVLFANEDELVSLFEVETFDEAIARLRGHRCEYAAITRGSHGAVVVHGDEVVTVPAVPVEVVDTTGAGDAFAAGFLRGITSGLDAERSARLGALAAAEVISHLGARPMGDLAAEARAAGLT